MDTAIELDFADGKYRFWLGLPQALELERKCGGKDSDGVLRPKSIFKIYDELSQGLGLIDEKAIFVGGGAANAADVLEIVRLGLIGGARGQVSGEEKEIGPLTAAQLVKDYCFPARPLSESLSVAWAVLNAAIEGVSLKKKAETPGSKAAVNVDTKPCEKGQ